MFPLLNTPLELVTVCAVLSLFVQVTVVPGDTVRFVGEKAKPAIETVFPVPDVGVVVFVLEGEP